MTPSAAVHRCRQTDHRRVGGEEEPHARKEGGSGSAGKEEVGGGEGGQRAERGKLVDIWWFTMVILVSSMQGPCSVQCGVLFSRVVVVRGRDPLTQLSCVFVKGSSSHHLPSRT